MAAYFTRAVPRPSGYYRSLNRQSTADVYDCTVGHSSSIVRYDDQDVYEVERLVSSRKAKVRRYILAQKRSLPCACSQGGIEYLVLWAGYRKEEATWVKEHDITPAPLQ